MTGNMYVYRQNHICLQADGRIIHVDPFRADTSPENADFIFITHDLYDHFSPKDIEKTAKENSVLVFPETMRDKVCAIKKNMRLFAVKPNEKYVADGLEFETVPAYNIGKPFHPQSAGWVGYIINFNGKRIYIAGDTDATPEAEGVKCDVAFVPVGGTYTMNALQAAKLVNRIKPEIAVPVHYGEIVGSKKDGLIFADAVDKNIKVEIKISF
jgi:L-ascorbate metabolism protein UlaG (beta-lactamase superfamily)